MYTLHVTTNIVTVGAGEVQHAVPTDCIIEIDVEKRGSSEVDFIVCARNGEFGSIIVIGLHQEKQYRFSFKLAMNYRNDLFYSIAHLLNSLHR